MRAAVFTLGCKVNQYESGAIASALRELGLDVIEGLFEADLYIINTCSVTAEADKKSRQAVSRVLKQNPAAKIIIVGCSSQNDAERFCDRPEVVAVFGSGGKIKNVTEVVARMMQDLKTNKDNDSFFDNRYVDKADGNSKSSVALGDVDKLGGNCEATNNQSEEKFKLPAEYEDDMWHAQSKTRAYVKIQDGCDNFCSYCRVPYLRGRSRSRGEDAVLAEVSRLSKTAHEIVLTGIDISSYGKNTNSSLARLVKYLGSTGREFVGVNQNTQTRLRLGSLECGVINEDLLKAMLDYGFCDHFHLSLQSGCDSVLRRMNRHYTTSDFLSKTDLIRKYFPYAGITTDVIAGFSGETEGEHIQTTLFLERVGFSDVHVFPYSPRKGTSAYSLPQLDKRVREERAHLIGDIAAGLKTEFIKKNLGRVCEVLAEDSEDGFVTGFTSNYIKVYTMLAFGKMGMQRLASAFGSGAMGENP